MPVFQRETTVRAPLDEVWDFHSRISGLEALTPGFLNLRIESVRGPDGEPDPPVLEAGAEVDASVRPFGVGPRQRWTSVILDRTEGDGTASFTDTMRGGPFPHWEHTHSFFAVSADETRIHDRVEYRLPGGDLGAALSPLAVVGFEPMFRHRHDRTRKLLE